MDTTLEKAAVSVKRAPATPRATKKAAEIQEESCVKFFALLDMAQKLPEMPITAWTYRNVIAATFDALIADLRQLPELSDTAKDKDRDTRQRDVQAGFEQIIDVVDALTEVHASRFDAPEAARSALCAMLASVGAQIRDLFSLYQVRPEDIWTTRGIVGFQPGRGMDQDGGRES